MKKNNYFILLLSVCMIGCSVQTKQNKEQENIVKRDTACVIEPFLRDGITYISSMKSKTATIFVSGNECLFLSTSFFLALLHGGSVPIIVGTMNNYVNFLFEIKTQPGVLLRPKR